MRRLQLPLLLVLGVAVSACTRGVTLNPEPETIYAVNVTNDLAEPMIVSFDDGSGTRLLGTVAAGGTERFVLAGAASQTVSIIARNEADTRTVRRSVTLVPGETVAVRLN